VLFLGLDGTAEECGIDTKGHFYINNVNVIETMEAYMNTTGMELLDVDIPFLAIYSASAKDPSYAQRYPGWGNAAMMFCNVDNTPFR
jgi:hypothetical protein